MADSSESDLSDPPSENEEYDDTLTLSTPAPSSRPSVDTTHAEAFEPPSKKRKTAASSSSLATHLENLAPASHPNDEDDNISLSEDGFSDVAEGSPEDDEYSLRDQAQTQCLWRDCEFGSARNNDELVDHVQSTHCATGGPKKTKYVCEWGECQKKTSNHPSGYALKAHMRSHTKEKPYYCALPECDKAFTRSDALAKHMRTVHEPEAAKGAGAEPAPTTTAKGKSGKGKLTNGSAKAAPAAQEQGLGPTHDEDGNEVDPSPVNDNITYIPAHHPITGQPGFMIHYPPDIHFTAWESAISADQLMRLLRRQVHWAQQEGEELKHEVEALEQQKREEWQLKEILLEGVLEEEISLAERRNLLKDVDERVRWAMQNDVQPAKQLAWVNGEPRARRKQHKSPQVHADPERTPSPPPTGGGFDGEKDPYDNYLDAQMAEYEERVRMRSVQNTPAKVKELAD